MTQKTINIKIPALKRPTLKQLQAKYPWVKKIERDISETKAVTLSLATVLEESEDYISGKEYKKRLPKGLLGYQHLEWLIEHQDEYPILMALLGKVYIDFSGLVVVDEYGHRIVPGGNQRGERWGAGWRWLSNGFLQRGRLAVSGQVALESRKLESSDAKDFEARLLALENWREEMKRANK